MIIKQAGQDDPQGAADQRAHDEWMDGEGADCVTTTGIWHAAIAWERRRVTVLQPDNERANYMRAAINGAF